jgi:hypothetical protein
MTSAGWALEKERSPWTQINSTNFETNITIPEDFYEPPTVDLTVLNSTSILVNWSEPPRDKATKAKGFRLSYATDSEVGKVEDFIFFGPIYVYDYSERSYLFTNFGMVLQITCFLLLRKLKLLQLVVFLFFVNSPLNRI